MAGAALDSASRGAHEARAVQQAGPPALPMVQDPTCLNDIEATVYRLKLENIGLRIFDVF